ncbi:MAG TPA: MASE1 domain-containing protein [Gemmataceae bacterium]|nr:MASE1 domain-containing protein [Gemmataceae bacterium]
MRRYLIYLGEVAALTAVYFGAARLGLSLAFIADQVTAVWPATGIALAALLLRGYHVWPGVALGAFLANVTVNESVGTALGIAAGNTLEALLAAWLLRRWAGFDPALERLKDVLDLIVLAAALSTTVSATIGVTSLCLGDVYLPPLQRHIAWADFESLWWVWWLGDATSDLLVAPVLLTWASGSWVPRPRFRLVEAVGLLAGLVAMSLLVFAEKPVTALAGHSLVYVVFPFIVWAALRFGQRGVTAMIFFISGIALWCTANDLGPFARSTAHENLILLQLFMAVVAATGLLLGAAISERDRAERRQAADYAVTQVLAKCPTLKEAAPRILRSVCECLGWDVGILWEVDARTDALRCVEVWQRPPMRAPEFEAVSRQCTFRRGTGLPGRVWASGTPTWIPDVARDLNFPRAPAAAHEGLHGAFGFPIRIGDRIVGVIEFFHRQIRRPDDDLLQMFAAVGSQIGQFIDRKQAEEAVRQQREELLAREQAARADAEAARRRLAFLAEASAILAASLDYPTTLASVARLVVPSLADWCAVEVVGEDRSVEQVIVVHGDPAKEELAHQLQQCYPRIPDPLYGVARVRHTGQPELYPEVSDSLLEQFARDPEQQRILRGLGLRSAMMVPLPSRERVLGVITFASDRPGRRYGPEDLVLAQDLADRCAAALDNARLYGAAREADRRKDEFLAMLAHELRNPLAPIRTAVQILGLTGTDTAAAARAREIIERQVRHMTRLVDDLLDVSRITRGQIKLQKEPTDLGAVTARAVETCRALIDARGHELTVELPTEPVWLEADPARLEQVICNLLTNAARYTEPHGRISVVVRQEGPEAELRVRDTGIGIRPEMLLRVFDLFAQADRSPDQAPEGLGIGLTLVRRLVELHGGRVTAASAGPGQGSEFVVRLPVLPGAAAPVEGRIAPSSVGRRRRVLVVDDNVDAAESLAMLLRLEGHEVMVAHDGPAALAAAQVCRPEVVFLDIGLPQGMSGHEVALRLRELPGMEKAFLVAVTGFGQDEDRQRSHRAGFDLHLTKPVDPDELRRLLADREEVGAVGQPNPSGAASTP